MTHQVEDKAELARSGGSSSSLVRALKVVIAASLILPSALFAAIASQEWRQLHSAAEFRAQKTASILREHATKVFETHELILDRVDDRTRDMSWQEIEQSEDLTRFLRGIVGIYSHVSSLLLVKPDGYLSNNSRRFPLTPPVKVADRDYFRIPAENPNAGTVIDEPVRGRVSGEPIINISRRRTSQNGEFSGVVTIALFLDYFGSFYHSLNTTGGDSVRLVRADGTVLVSEPAATTGVEKLSPQSGLMKSIAAGSTATYEAVSELDSGRRIHAYEKVGSYPLYVSYGVSLQALREQWHRTALIYGLLAVLATVGLAAMGWVALRQARAEQSASERWRKEALERERAERLYRNLYNKAPVPQQSLDAEGTILSVSDTWLELVGYERSEVVGRPFRNFLPSEQHELFETSRARLVGGGSLRDVPLEVLHRSGHRVPILWSGAVERDVVGGFVKTFGALIDVTARRQAEEALRQAQKMEAVGQLTGGVAHDFNNLLAVILGNLDLLRKRLPNDPNLLRLAENALQGAQRGASLTQRMLSFARRQDLKPEPVDVPALVRGMEDLLRRTLGSQMQIETSFPLGSLCAQADANQLEMALLNLAVNARDAMAEGGIVTIALRRAMDSVEQPEGLEPGKYLCLSVADTGEGMDEVTLSRAREPFFTTKGVGKGTGLGISMVHGFAEQSGGKLVLKSRKGEGTTAEIWLPEAAASVADGLPEVATRYDPPQSDPLDLLVVDDDALVRMNTVMMLEDLGHSVMEAASGQEALKLLEENAFDLLITDQAMPKMTGVQLAVVVRALLPDLPILVATGYAELPSNVHLPRLSKPFDQTALTKAIAACLDKKEPNVVPFRLKAD